jgi:hypothetical protein
VARLIGPSEASREVKTIVTSSGSTKGLFKSKAGRPATFYLDSAATQMADILTLAGAAIAGSTVTIDAYSMLPLIQFPDGVDTLYVIIDGGPIWPIYAREDDRFDALNTAVQAAQSSATGALAKLSNLSDLASASTARTNLGLGSAATKNVGTTSSDVAAGDAPAVAQAAAISAASTDATTKANARADRALSNLTAVSTARTNLRIGAARPTKAFGVTVTAVGTDPKPVDYFGGYLYGAVGTTLRRSSDDGATWTTIATTPFEAQRLLPTADGEVVMTSDNKLYKTSGWSANPSTATWNLKLTANGTCNFFRFGIDGDGTKFITNQYSASVRADSRYVHISTDAGTTWNQVWDTNALWPATAAESHLHGCCYDPWEDRFWFSEGHGSTGVPGVDNPRGIYYSNNNGSTWTRVSGGYADSLAALPTTLVATDDGIVCGTDDDPNGILGIRRAPAANLALEVAWRRWEPKAGAYGFAERGFRDPNTGIVYFGYRSEYAATSAYIAAGTASSGGLVWDSGLTGLGNKVQNLVVTPSGRLLAVYLDGGGVTVNLFRGSIGLAGTPDLNTGNTGGGTISSGTAVAAGINASATGASATAIGSAATANATQATAVGTSATSVGNGVAVGYNAQSTGADKTVAVGATAAAAGANASAVGYGASASGASATALGSTALANATQATALGKSASAAGNGTAVGTSATASGVDQSSAFGCTTTASGARSTAVGYGATASGTDTTVLGTTSSAPSTGGTALGKSAAASTNGTAVGFNAAASGSTDSTAVGTSTTASGTRATAFGYGATAGGSDSTVVGHSASAPSTNGTALGKSAAVTGSGLAVGKSATASGTDLSTAVGTGATASVTRATALGHTATAGHDNAVALGYGVSSTAANQVQVGARHIEGVELGADPVAPAVDGFRLYAKDNGAGKTGLYVRFATGAVVQIAVEP